jgi:3-deoxy-D-manno-octulosonic-acid transferase
MKLLYNIFIQLYSITAKLLSFNNKKAKLWVDGRAHIFNELTNTFHNNTSPVIWMHCASLGEFEQGRPIIEKFKVQSLKFKVLITFFSPSGYEVQKQYAGADWIFYLPIDTAKNAKLFYEIVNPKLILFVKYEFWYHYINEAKALNIPLLLVSGIFRDSQPFFKWYGSLHREMLRCFTYLFLQNQASFDLLKTIHGADNITVCGDTRFDRVIEIASQIKSYQTIENFIGKSKLIVAGSTWTEDDEELDHYANTHPEIKFIIAPHDIGNDRLTECLKLYKHSVLYSKIDTATNDINVVIIDNIGMLSTLYRYATICFVGGGFGGDGVHNVLEAAVYHKPVVFGPEYEKYIEAIELIEANAAVSVDDALQLEQTLNHFITNDIKTLETGTNAGNYVKNNSGATQKIVHYLQEKILLHTS